MARNCPSYKSLYQQERATTQSLRRQLKEAHEYADELEDKLDGEEIETVSPRPDSQRVVVPLPAPCGSLSIEITVSM